MHPQANLPYRIGVFDTSAEAERAIQSLLDAGFRKEELAVLCAEKCRTQFASEVPTPSPAGELTPQAIATGGVLGATIGGLTLAVTALASGGASLLAAGTVLIGGGALAGSFTGAMMTRGFEKEIADYYDQAVQSGKILVAVEVHGDKAQARRARAEEIFKEAGKQPVALGEG